MSGQSFVQRFEAQVDQRRDATAVSFGDRSLSYGELDSYANRLARLLVARGVQPDSVVAIAFERSLEAVLSILAVLKAGACYLPLDPGYPAERLAFMLEDARPALLLKQHGLALPGQVSVAQLEVQLGSGELSNGDDSRLAPRHTPESLAYAIYTSGSTGKPKGVAMVHGALDNLIDWQLRDSAAGPQTSTLQFAPLSFDVHFQEIFSTWCSGGRLVLVEERLRLEMLRLLELIERERIERIFLPFIALQSMADIAVAHGRLPGTLREVITAGEQLQITRAVAELFTALPQAKLFNHYGPSETHVVTSHELTGAPSTWPPLPPIGVALPNVELAVLREDGSVVAPGEEGELFLGGVALARGYLHRPELTAERFVTLAASSGKYAGRRFYKTGDLVQELPSGALQFLGRLDGQVKVRGYRIELGEIEVALSAHPGVKEAAVAVREPKPGDKRIYAWLVMADGQSAASLRSFLQQRLPEYMLPSAFVALPALPRTPSGKVDKRSLPDPSTERPALSTDYAAASNDFERRLLAIWEEALGVQGIGVNDVFFELGGNSLLALRVAAAAERALGQPLPIVQFFEHPTIAGQAAYLADPNAAASKTRRVARRDRGARAPIAVIGMAGRFPGAGSVAELWKNLEAGLESVTRLSPQALAAVPAEERDDPSYVPVRGVVDGAELFDAAFFGVTPAEAAVLDPQQRLLLELSWHALEDAGYGPKTGSSVVGVYAGTHNNSYYLNSVLAHPEAIARVGTFTTMVASEKDYVATRIANKLDLAGPALSIHTACSTSLVAIATAVQQLRAGQCDIALAGGAALSVPQLTGHVYQEGGMLSRDGHTRTFDAEANGTLFSDGAAMVVLKPLDDALAAGDHVYAVICGVGVNNDGGQKASFTAPSVQGQAAVIQMALEDADVSARDIQYVEAHGTATPVGDPIEVEALTQAYRASTPEQQFCGIGSIKSNFGHLTAAAGVAGVIKVALSLDHERIPASLHYRAPNPKIAFTQSPFFVVAEPKAWPRGNGVRRAGVSSFGVGGTNAHVIMEEAPAATESGPSIAPQLLLLSARNESALERNALALAQQLEAQPELKLADAAFTLAVGRTAFVERRAVVASSPKEAAAKLRSGEGARGKAASAAPRLAFAFPGQGAQYVDMGRNLYESEALFRLTVDECAELLMPRLGRDLRDVLYPKRDREAARAELKRTEITQTALFTIEYALAKTLMSWGVRPAALVGHSIGEFVAACLAGVFELDAALGLVATRGRLMQSMPAGCMLSVRDSADNVARYLPAELDLAAENGPGLCVVGGPADAIERFRVELEGKNILAKLLETSHAFHSRSMDEAVVRFADAVKQVKLSAPRIPIVSTATGTWLTDAEACDPGYWSSQLRRTVRFVTSVKTLTTEGPFTLLEVGPRRTLTTLALQRLPGDDSPRPTAVACLNDRAEDDGEWKPLLEALGKLWTLGVNLDFPAFFRNERRRRIPLPGYAFERARHWLEPAAAPTLHATTTAALPGAASAPSISPATPAVAPEPSPMTTTQTPPRAPRLVEELKQLFEQASGIDFSSATADTSFIEAGVDSLLVTQLATKVKQTYKVNVSFRQLMEDLSSFALLANHLDQKLPAEAAAPAPAAVAVAAPAAAASAPAAAAAPAAAIGFPMPQLPTFAAMPTGAAVGVTQQLLQLQMAQLTLLQQQLALVAGAPAVALAPAAVATPAVVAAPAIAAPAAAAPAAPAPSASAAAPSASGNGRAEGAEKGQIDYDVKKAFGAIARIHKQSDAMTPKQLARLEQLTARYVGKTGQSKAHTQEYRHCHADPRVVTGFKPRIKEIIYPIVANRSEGCRLWDLDGNEYIDALNGFGSNYFGYRAKFLNDAMKAQLDNGIEIGPQTPLAGQSAKLVCELTGMDRAAFCNTGSEAVMGALRIARTVTGRGLVVAFAGSYHGIFDEVIVRDTKNMRSIPAAPGIMAEAVENILVLEYGTEESLRIIRERSEEIAAVLVEPVQSRRPDFQPRAFLHEVRKITRESGSALIFDEVITGFRVHPGGAQVYYGIEADLTTYGKIVGGGMPIGVIAGRNPWMDALDGGQWQYGDASIPTAGVTYFAGTFVRHPLSMAAVHAALAFMKEQGPALQERINARTTAMANELNAFFKSVGAPLEIRHFSSLWKTFFTEAQPYGELLFCYLRDRGIHIWDGFPCFLTIAHGDAEVAMIVKAFKEAVREMQAGEFLPGSGAVDAPSAVDVNQPPVAGARLGRDPQGNPAWFIPHPETPGKYVQIS